MMCPFLRRVRLRLLTNPFLICANSVPECVCATMTYHFIHIEDPETLSIKEGEDLTAVHEVVIDVAYAGINRADVLQRMGLIHPDASPVMG